MSLDHDGRLILAARAARSPAFWAQVPDVSAGDDTGLVTLTVDAAARVVAATVDSPERLRDPRLLERVVQDAFRAADTARAVSVQLGSPGGPGPVPETATGLVAALRPRTRRDVDVARLRPISDPTAPSDPTPPDPTEADPHTAGGRSDNGYVEVDLGPGGDPVAVRADPAWLSAATGRTLATALVSAFAEAHRAQARHLEHDTAGGTAWPTR